VVIKLTPSGASKRCQAPCGTITTIPAFSVWDCTVQRASPAGLLRSACRDRL